MHLPTPSLLTLLSTLTLALMTLVLADNPPTTPYIISYLAKWELQSLSNDTLALSPSSAIPSALPSTAATAKQKRHPSTSNVTPIRYDVPDTTTTLYIRLSGNLISEDAVKLAIVATYETMSKMIEDPTVGDVPLPLEAEPLYINPAQGVAGGAYILAQSKYPQHLTFGIVESAMQGLWDVLVGGGRYLGCSFEIWDGQWGHVGDGSLVSI